MQGNSLGFDLEVVAAIERELWDSDYPDNERNRHLLARDILRTIKEVSATHRDKLVRELEIMAAEDHGDIENQHIRADMLLLDYIDDDAITKAFRALPRWYS